MRERKGITPSLAQLRQILKPMTFREKVDYLWTYYKELLWVVFLIAVVVCVAVSAISNKRQNVVASGFLVNCSISQEGLDYLDGQFLKTLENPTKKDIVRLQEITVPEGELSAFNIDAYQVAQTLIAEVSVGELDYAILDDVGMAFYAGHAVFLDLRTFFTPDELSALEADGVLAYGQDAESGETYPVGVDIQQLAFTADTMNGEKRFFCIGGNKPDLDAVWRVWNHIRSWQSR